MAELISTAELTAEEATKLPEFRNVNLGGVKDKIAQILDLIGRVEGIFSTYTKHDISHVNSMLRLLDWIVPPQTKPVMTVVDWLMVVLAVYLHDLGMVVTSAEFEGRLKNEEFVSFMQQLQDDTEAKDYLARANAMTGEERNRFFYQEYVRKRHATRIRQWITGQLSRFWPEEFQTISGEIASLMTNLPTRFRENLGVVCESHHGNNLDKRDIFPLAQRYGSDPAEIANVQYAALLLRTVDLIHVTKDRTPSEMYKAIRFSDLKSVDEWDKQRGIWSVHMKSREFDPNDEQSHFIEITADFTEERPFFALTEYIAWADQEVQQTKRWADVSQQLPDARGFAFPWRGIKGDVRVEGNLPRQMRFELDRGRLLDLLVGHTIYNEPTVAVRELLQNAIDAVRFQYHIERRDLDNRDQPNKMGRVLIEWNPDTRVLTVTDNGIGMDLATIENHLLRVGSSFYDTPQFQSENSNFTPISRFGIGILTCFMISDNIEIVTCHKGSGRRIRMTSVHADYLLKDLPAGDPQLKGIDFHGTKVKLVVRPSVNLEEKRMIDIVRQWIIVPVCEVLYQESDTQEIQIGFKNASDALRFITIANEASVDSRLFEVLNTTFQEPDGATYDFAYVVRKSYFPERVFVRTDNRRVSAVCIEGIRADWHLPGFRPDFWAMLSVRGNRRFRTTVSRQSLEVDEEYTRVAKLCAKQLFAHVQNEVERISSFPGNPLSQASTAGRWVYSSLINAANPGLEDTLNGLYAQLPLVVLEHSPSDKAVSGGRALKSLSHVESLSEFWTIESRTVDYLGVISRDLGRELNIYSFLGSLAPEQYDPTVNPIVIDPEAFSTHLLESHQVTEVDFSRKHQRTLLRWQKITNHRPQLRTILAGIHRDQFFRSVLERGLSRLLSSAADDLRLALTRISRVMMISSIKGDVGDVLVVRTRLVTVLVDTSPAAQSWKIIENSLRSLKSPLSTDDQLTLLLGLVVIAKALESLGDYRSRRYGTPDFDDFQGLWRSIIESINSVLSKQPGNSTLPSELRQVIGKENTWFDAASFWRDWNNPEARFGEYDYM
jgi:molecular chaperone HtpG